MLATLIIVFREVFEAMLVVGIAMAASKELDASFRWIFGGVAAGLLLAGVVALFADMIAASMSGMGQEFFNATILLSAALLMVWTAVWMRKHGKEMSMRIHDVCRNVDGGVATRVTLALVIAMAVAREGSEVVLFMHGIVASGGSEASAIVTGAVAGLVLGVAVAAAIYRALIHIPLRHLFSVVTLLIALLAAGMASQGVSFLVMVDAVPTLGETLWNSSAIIPEQGAVGQLLQALMGYDDRPSGMQVLTFAGVLFGTWLAIRLQGKKPVRSVATAASLLLVCVMVSLAPGDAYAKKVYSPIVEAGELEFEYAIDYTFDRNPAKDGNARHQFELEYAVTDRWLTAIYGDFRKAPGQGFSYQGLKWENIYQLFEQGERWLDAGVYVEYIMPKKSLNAPDVIEFKLLLEKEVSQLVHTANLTLKQELGANATANTLGSYAWRSKWRWMRQIEPAIELYGAIGEVGNSNSLARQSHQIGPVISGKLSGGIGYEVGYLFGLTSGSDDGMLKFLIGYEF